MLAKYKINYEEIRFPQDVSGDTLFVYGCGEFSRPHHLLVKFVNYYSNRFNRIYILPASFDLSSKEVKEFITTLPKNIIVYCRERYSYQDVRWSEVLLR